MAEEAAAAPMPHRKLPITLIAVLGVSIIEAAGFFVAFKFTGSGPQVTQAAEKEPAKRGEAPPAPEPNAAPPGQIELPVLRGFRVSNDKTGAMYIYDLDVSVVVKAADKEKMEALVKERGGEIGDSLARIMRGATERMLREHDLRALRNQVQEALAEIAGTNELVRRVLIPRFVPIRSD
jgi:flagellar basal body-associated protein FliL